MTILAIVIPQYALCAHPPLADFQHQRRGDDDHRAAGERAHADRFVQEQRAPERAEHRNQESDGEGSGRPDVGEQAEVDEVGGGAAQERDSEHGERHLPSEGGGGRRRGQERHDDDAGGDQAADGQRARRELARAFFHVHPGQGIAGGGADAGEHREHHLGVRRDRAEADQQRHPNMPSARPEVLRQVSALPARSRRRWPRTRARRR